jgi:hypothetical protein
MVGRTKVPKIARDRAVEPLLDDVTDDRVSFDRAEDVQERPAGRIYGPR